MALRPNLLVTVYTNTLYYLHIYGPDAGHHGRVAEAEPLVELEPVPGPE